MLNEKLLEKGIFEAEKELKAIRAKLAAVEPLQTRAATLEAYIARSRELMKADGVGDKPQPSVQITVVRPARRTDPAWVGAKEALDEAKRALTVPEIVEQVIARGWRLDRRWAREVVRAGMVRRRPDTFEKVGPKHWVLADWPNDMKKEPS
jgi:hypothetical protein